MKQKFKKSKNIFAQLIFASMLGVSVVMLPACSGGGGGGSTAPVAATVDPANGETSVERNVVVTATFVEPITDSDVDNTTFTLKDNGNNLVPGTASSLNDVATYDPTNNLGVLRTYTAALSASIEKSAGGPITAMSWSFTTRDGVWGGAATIESDDIASSYPRIAFAPNGDAVVAWQNNNNVFVNSYDAATASWGTATQINTAGGVTGVQVAVDTNGNAMVVWAHWDGIRDNIFAAYYNGASWAADAAIEVNDNTASNPQVAFDGFGDATVVWLQSDGTADSIYTNRYEPSGAGWAGASLLETTDGVAYAPQVAVDDGGDAIAVWAQDNLGGYDAVYAAYYTKLGGWVAAGEIGQNVGAGEDASNVAIAQDGDGNAIAIWHQIPPGGGIYPDVWANRYTGGNGGSWGTAVSLESTVNSGTEPQVAFDAHGNAMAIWTDWDLVPTARVRTKIYSLNTGWGSTVNADSGVVDTAFPKLAVDPEGHAIVYWREASNMVESIWANRYHSGNGWGTAELLETDDTYTATTSDIAIDSQGNAFAVWAQRDPMAAENKIWINRFE